MTDRETPGDEPPDDLFEILLDPSPSGESDATLDLPAGFAVLDAARALDDLFRTQAGVSAVDLLVGGHRLGRSTRHQLIETRTVGAGDGATLPGHSGAYRIVVLGCAEPTCAARLLRVHVDERAMPACPNGHGSLRPVAA
ncbi:hypothetical protein [Dactylosporangium sp. NPDC000521]|uniref:hypothetical protein n=1 Tax=Dactylosporangium sp. NPDC000521 TaxID=3363975 RepID=UPI0036B202DE